MTARRAATGAPEESTGTLSAASLGEVWQARPRPFLFRVLDAWRPLAPAARLALDGVRLVTFGRGAGCPERREGALHLGVQDPFVSLRHARLGLDGGRWVLEDTSKNGTWVNGERIRTRTLGDGDVLEIGSTFFLLRPALLGGPEGLEEGAAAPGPGGLVTLLPALERTYQDLARVARSAVSVILLGETGTGKEVAARALHALAGRTGPFVAVNCGALPANLVESELFGHRKGAFSGALEDRPGLVRAAAGGTLLLDEVGDLPLAAQAALLRVLQEREVLPVGATRPVPVDLRVVAASHLDLRALVAEGRFRADLEARLGGLYVELPPLRERREDLGLLLAALLRRLQPSGAEAVKLERTAARALLAHAWPKNVRELEHVLASALALAGDQPIAPRHLTFVRDAAAAAPRPAAPLGDEDAALRAEVVRQLQAHGGNVSAVARALGTARRQVQRWVKRFELDPVTFRPR